LNRSIIGPKAPVSEGSDQIDTGVLANERITSLTGALLIVLLVMMGVTVLSVRKLLPEHFLLGFVLIPPLLLKMASTGYRFARYYTRNPSYRRAGPPRLLLRLIAPVVLISTLVLFATGVELWLFGLRFGSIWIEAHKLSFMVWVPATAIHVLAHLARTGEVAAEELTSGAVDRTVTRRSLVVGSLLAGIVLAVATLTYQSPFIFFRDG
jgi:hypothetical protein